MNFSKLYVNRYFLTLALSLSLFTASINAQVKQIPTNNAPKTVAAKQAVDVPFVSQVLPNGLEVIVLQDSSVPIVTVELAARNGSFTEPPELNGLSHLYEHMFFKTNGAIQRLRERRALPSDNYLRDIGKLGITYNGSTREEVVNYYFTTTSENARTAMNVVRDATFEPAFDEGEFGREKLVVIGEIDRNESNPFFYLSRAMSDKLFYKYPSRKNPLGNRETVTTATTAKMRLIQNRYYVPNNCALVVTGDITPEMAFTMAKELFGSWKRADDPFKKFPLVEHPPLTESAGEIIQQPVQNVIIQIGWHGPSIGKDDAATYAADVFSFILQQPDSRFQRKLVDSGLTAGVGFGYYTQRNVGPINLTVVTTPEKAKAALKAVYAELDAFNKPDYFTDVELENAKNLLATEDLQSREKLSEYTHTLSFWWSSTGIDYFRGYQKNLRAISRGDINRYISNYVNDKPHVGLALISPDAQKTANITPQDLIGELK